jgi:hypothetical protein
MNFRKQSQRSLPPSARAVAAALRTYKAISERWSLSETELCGLLGQESLAAAKIKLRDLDAPDGPAIMIRISRIVAIFKAINTILPFGSVADGWIRRGNSSELTGGKSALQFMLDGGDDAIDQMRRYLDSVRMR